jgi:hypothetical protein
MPKIVIENPFVMKPPSPQNALDVFSGEWASRFPADGPSVQAGTVPLFEDPRLGWADVALRELTGVSFADQTVLELGPLEAGQTYGMAKLGAQEIVAVEANARAYLKCLIAKEVLGIPHAHFLLGDALPYLRDTDRTFDVGVACAFLNHMTDPVEVIALLAQRCRKVFVWNVVFDESLFVKQPEMTPRFGPPQSKEVGGFKHTLHPHSYGEGFDYGKFLGGAQSHCSWMRPAEIVGALRHFGFDRITSHVEDNPFGKAVSAVGVKS